MAPMLGRLYDALRAGNGPDDKARKAVEEVVGYEGRLPRLRLDMSERFNRAHRSMIVFPIAAVLGMFALQWQILLRLPS